VEREPSGPAVQPRAPKRSPETLADVAVVPPAAERVAKDEIGRLFELGSEPALAQESHDRRGEDDLAPGRRRF
jgi:hypothetical protein